MIEEITSPPFLDDTAQEMVTKLQAIANNIKNNAGQVSYSNTTSQLQATKVQTAIDEVKGITDTISSNLTHYTYINLNINTTDTARTKVVASGLSSNYRIISIQPIYNNDLFYYVGAKGMPILSVRDDIPTSISVMVSSGTLADTADRTLKLCIGYTTAT